MRVPGLGTNEFKQILLVKSFELVPKPKSRKLRLNLHGTCFGGKINWFGPKNSARRRAPDLENQESGRD